MSMPTKLSEKHWKVLKMLEDMSREDAAREIGWKKDHIDKLCVGSVSAGGVATLFKVEYLKLQTKQAEETKHLISQNTKMAQKLIGRVFDCINKKKKVSPEDQKILSLYTNALAKFTPTVNVKNLSYSYTKGLNAEELVHEFKRLKTIAESSFDRGRVPEVAKGRAGELSEVDE